MLRVVEHLRDTDTCNLLLSEDTNGFVLSSPPDWRITTRGDPSTILLRFTPTLRSALLPLVNLGYQNPL
jgi:hypothetical protein